MFKSILKTSASVVVGSTLFAVGGLRALYNTMAYDPQPKDSPTQSTGYFSQRSSSSSSKSNNNSGLTNKLYSNDGKSLLKEPSKSHSFTPPKPFSESNLKPNVAELGKNSGNDKQPLGAFSQNAINRKSAQNGPRQLGSGKET